jgi:Na+-translocating ferredoxin:NAD+ oxidoreductase subunit B
VLETVLTTTGVMFAVAVVFTVTLVVANVKLAVEVDPRQAEIEELLPGANCGGCGYASCGAYAKGVVKDDAALDACSVGGPSVAEGIGKALGKEVAESYPQRPVIHCSATQSQRLKQGNYVGEPTCSAAQVVGGVQGCTYGCLGFGDCVDACDYDAMVMVEGLPVIDYEKCIGCGACSRACPRSLIEQIPFKVERMMVVGCSSHDPAKAVRDVCEVGCIGCSACAKVSPDLFSMDNGLPVLDYSTYTGDEDFGPALKKCPRESILELGKPSAADQEALADVEAVTVAGRPAEPARPTKEDLDWRG